MLLRCSFKYTLVLGLGDTKVLLLSSYLWPQPKATRAPFLMCDKSDAASAVEDSLGAKHRGARLGEGRELEAADFP